MPKMRFVTNKRVGFWGAAAHVPPGLRLVSDCLGECGQNVGNLFIGDGLWRATEAPIKEYWDFYGRQPEEFDEKFDVLFVPASNFLFEHTDLTDQYNFFSKTKAQIFMFGLGSQVRDLNSIKIPKATEAFIKLAAERSASIGVRGDVTETVARRLGIRNVDIVGCPSMMEVPDAFAPVPDISNPETIIAGNFSSNARDHAFSAEGLARSERILFDELVLRNGYYVLQNERHEIALRQALAYSKTFNEEETWHIQRVTELMSLSTEKGSLLNFLRWRTKLFFDISEWLRFMSTVEFSFGTRFHGNVAAIRAGRPAYVLCHDYRTLELCRLYKIPHRIVDANSEPLNIAQLADDCDMATYQANYPRLQEIWTDFVSKNGFQVIKEV